jgi:clan AA aspartic protease (TIGR02281 family)
MLKRILFLFILLIGQFTFAQKSIEMKPYRGVFMIDCKINGIPMEFILDTGASNVSLSSTEALFLIKQGLITEDDILGSTRFQNANGQILEGTKIKLKSIEIAGIIVNDVIATVVSKTDAPLLLGQSFLSKLGPIKIDGNKLIIESSENSDFLIKLANNFSLSEMQSKMKSENFDFIERLEKYTDNYTYLYGEKYNVTNETAYSFVHITVEKESEKISKIQVIDDEKVFERLQIKIQRICGKGKSFFENNGVKTVYTTDNIHFIFEVVTDDGIKEHNISIIPINSDFNHFDGLTKIVYQNRASRSSVFNQRVTKWKDFKYDYVNEKYGNEFEYSRTSIDDNHNFHLDYEFDAENIRVSLVQNGQVKFSYFNNEKALIAGRFKSLRKDIDGKYIVKKLTTVPKLGNLTTNKTIKNFMNNKDLVKLVVENGELSQLEIFNLNGEIQEKLKFKNRKIIE